MVAAEAAFVIVARDGPEISVQLYDDIVPSASVPLPLNETLFNGNVIAWSAPAFTVGVRLAALTVTCTLLTAVAASLSVTFNWNW